MVLGMQCKSDNEKDQKEENQQSQAQKDNSKSDKNPEKAKVKQGVKIAKATGKALKQKLNQAIADGGISNAVSYCSANAIDLTDSLSQVHNASISRVTHKPRNPANKADSLEMTLIKEYQQKLESGNELKPELIEQDTKEVVYAPITIEGQLCLNCHGKKGKDIADEDYIAIQLNYDNDQATGFEMGDLRGMWKVAFEKEAM